MGHPDSTVLERHGVSTATRRASGRTRRRIARDHAQPRAGRTDRPTDHWSIVATVCVGAFMGQLDVSIVALGLPRIGTDLHAGVGATAWVSLSYLLVLVCSLAAMGHWADRVGRKRLYVQGFVVFTVASALCAAAPNLPWLIAARVLQGAGAAMLQANSIALIRQAVARERLGRAVGVQGTAQAIGLAAGPALGGALLVLGGWRWLFLVNVPAGVAGTALGWRLLPADRPAHGEAGFDSGGALALAVAAGGLLLACSLVREPGGAAAALAAGALAVVAATALVRWERRAPSPVVDLALLRRPGLAVGLAGALVSYMVMFGALFVVPYYLTAQHVSAAAAGLQLAALPVALAVVAPFAGRATDRAGARTLTAAGILLTAAALAALALWHDGPERVAALAVAGAGLGAFTPANNAAVMASAPRQRAGAVGGLLNTVRGLGTAFGVAVAGLVYATAQPAGHGLTLALAVLAAIAALAGVLLARRLGVGPAGLRRLRGERRAA